MQNSLPNWSVVSSHRYRALHSLPPTHANVDPGPSTSLPPTRFGVVTRNPDLGDARRWRNPIGQHQELR
jgi:hypothetical protein